MYCLSKLDFIIGKKEAHDYHEKSLEIIKRDKKWQYFFHELGIIYSPKSEREFVFPDFKSGRELDGDRLT